MKKHFGPLPIGKVSVDDIRAKLQNYYDAADDEYQRALIYYGEGHPQTKKRLARRQEIGRQISATFQPELAL